MHHNSADGQFGTGLTQEKSREVSQEINENSMEAMSASALQTKVSFKTRLIKNQAQKHSTKLNNLSGDISNSQLMQSNLATETESQLKAYTTMCNMSLTKSQSINLNTDRAIKEKELSLELVHTQRKLMRHSTFQN